MTASLTLHQHVPAPPAEVWKAWTDPEVLRQWWWPMFADTTYDLDVRPEGHWRVATAAAGGMAVGGAFTTVDPPQRLTMTWIWEPPGDVTDVVTVTLTPDGDGTAVDVDHETAPEAVEQYRQGWTDVLARLAHHPF